MGVRKLEELRAYKLALAFKLECYKLLDDHPRASANFKLFSQFDGSGQGWRDEYR